MWVALVTVALLALPAALGASALAGPGPAEPGGRSAGDGIQERRGAIDENAVDAFLEEQRERHHIPGMSVAVIEGGRVVYTQGYGEAEADRPMQPHTPVPVGSLSETFTAVLVLQLVEEGRLDLDTEVRSRLPEADEDIGAATVGQLLTREGKAADVGISTVVADRGYQRLVGLVEAVTGRPYAEALEARILDPLGMDSTGVATEGVLGAAQGHIKLFGFPVADDAPRRLGSRGRSDIVSTAEDLAQLARSVGLQGGPQVLSSATLRKLWDTRGGTRVYTMGWEATKHGSLNVGGARGMAPTYYTQLLVVPSRDAGYVLTTTSDHVLDRLIEMPQLRTGMLDLVTGGEPEPTGPAVGTIGLVLLGMLVLSVALQTWSFQQLRRWRWRARFMTRSHLVRLIAPHAILPVLVLVLAWPLVPQLLGEQAGSLVPVARYLFPDIALVVMLAVLPDLVKAGYMTVTAIQVRRSRRPRWARLP